jgi:hypothetical protein
MPFLNSTVATQLLILANNNSWEEQLADCREQLGFLYFFFIFIMCIVTSIMCMAAVDI